MSSYRFVTNSIHLLAGSKHEYRFFSREIKQRGRVVKPCFSVAELSHIRPRLFVAGTGHYTKHYDALVDAALHRKGVVHHYGIPGIAWMPALEIAHEFAEYLGIDPEWRHGGS